MNFIIELVKSRRQIRDFIWFPESLYSAEPRWSPPLWSDEVHTYDGKKNPVLRETDYVLILARREGKVIGRNLVYVNHLSNAHFRTRKGHFGAFECVDEEEVARAILGASEDWLREQGVDAIQGPIHPVAELWGALVDGFETPGVFMTPWNPPYYDRLIKAAGYEGVKDLVAYEIDARATDFRLSQRYLDFYDHFMARHPDFSFRRISLKNLKTDAEYIWRLTNISLIGNWGFMPANYDTMQDMVGRLKAIVDPDAVWFAEDKGKPIAYCLGYPDLNIILRKTRGRLFPFGWLTLLRGIKKLHDYRLFGLAVDPRYHGMGVDALMYVHLTKTMAPRHIRLEANWILEDNVRMNNSLVRLDMKLVKRYRVYEKSLSTGG